MRSKGIIPIVNILMIVGIVFYITHVIKSLYVGIGFKIKVSEKRLVF